MSRHVGLADGPRGLAVGRNGEDSLALCALKGTKIQGTDSVSISL